MSILLTGASGFIGHAILQAAQARGRAVRPVFRNETAAAQVGAPEVSAVLQSDLNAHADWHDALVGVTVVVHSAARVHVMHDTSADPLAEFRKVNVDGTLNLACQAAEVGVKRFIFISSIKVNGEGTDVDKPYTAFDTAAPIDPYGVSKHEAEEGLKRLAAETGMEVVIIRPVLVYGPGVKANFRSMMRWLYKGVPLPLGAIHNQRSLVALDNLVDLVVTCIGHPAAANQTFLVSDGEDLSVSQLLRRLGAALGKPTRLLPVPAWLITVSASLLGKKAVAQRLCGSLQVDISHTCETLGWRPPVSVDEALSKTAEAYLKENR